MVGNNKKYFAAFICSLLITTALSLSGCGKKQEESFDPYAEARPVRLMTLEGAGQGWVKSYPAKTEAKDSVDASFEVAGKIIELPVTRGMQVEKEQVLARLDARDFENELAAKKAVLVKAEAELNRYRQLYEDDAVSLQELEIRERNRNVAEADKQIAEKAVQDTILRAPFKGVLAVQYAENHQSVKAKEPIVKIQNNDAVEVDIYVPERDLAVTRSSALSSSKVMFDAFPGREFDLTLEEFETQADPVTQTFKVKFILPRPEGINILPGMSAKVTLSLQPKEGTPAPSQSVFLVPSAAVSPGPDGKSYVWVFNAQTQSVQAREVFLGAVSGTESVEVRSGLNPGESIVIAGTRHLREGMKVTPKTSDEKLAE